MAAAGSKYTVTNTVFFVCGLTWFLNDYYSNENCTAKIIVLTPFTHITSDSYDDSLFYELQKRMLWKDVSHSLWPKKKSPIAQNLCSRLQIFGNEDNKSVIKGDVTHH